MCMCRERKKARCAIIISPICKLAHDESFCIASSLSYAVNYTIRQGGGHVYCDFWLRNRVNLCREEYT